MIPVIAIIGRPNVGKSTIFNRLTRSRDALVFDMPGVTRDRQYGEGKVGDKPFIVVDTGGLYSDDDFSGMTSNQVWQAVSEADFVLFVVDARDGIHPDDCILGKQIRKKHDKVLLVINKIDGVNQDTAAEFYSLGFGEPFLVSAAHNRGITVLIDSMLADVKVEQIDVQQHGIKLAIIGKPNAGKSTLINKILGEERLLASDLPGTTRDSIFVDCEMYGNKYTLIDTAGVRRKAKVTKTVEKFSVIKTLQSIEYANVVLLLIDATELLTDQDLSLIEFVVNAGKCLVVAFNKWDSVDEYNETRINHAVQYKLQFIDYIDILKISALQNKGIKDIFKSVMKAYRNSIKEFSSNDVTKILEAAITKHPLPLIKNRRIKLRYAHLGGRNPPVIVIHGNQTKSIPDSYKKYLTKYFREKLGLFGTPIKLIFKTGDNPYADKKTTLREKQLKKRKRLKKYAKKTKK